MTVDPEGAGPRLRRSPGGHVVEQALAESGWRGNQRVALVETAAPQARGYEVVLCQNAWNFLPADEFRRLLADYPLKGRFLYRLRRVVAHFNVRRAKRVVVLSLYMGDLLRPIAGGKLRVVEADVVPAVANASPSRPGWLEKGRRFVVVPGTITWYKRPQDVLRMIAPAQGLQIIFAGADDGSGCLADLMYKAVEVGHDVRVQLATHAETLWLVQNAELTVIPSALESLSLALAEALLMSPRVVASDIDVHREIAQRVKREPSWSPPNGVSSPTAVTRANVDDWRDVAAARSGRWKAVVDSLSG